MKNLHAKSPCCREKIIRFGSRRRQCVSCRKTWRIRQKKKGRKTNRPVIDLVEKYLRGEIPPLYRAARCQNRFSEAQLQRRLKKSLERFVLKTPWPGFEYNHSFIVIADAMMIKIQSEIYAFYFMLFRPTNSNQAIIAKPYIQKGKESWLGWHRAFTALNPKIIKQTRALVSDGHSGLLSAAKLNDWIIQRCNFHIIAKIQGRRSRWLRSRNKEEGERLYALVNGVLTDKSETKVRAALRELQNHIFETKSAQLKRYLSGFIKHSSEYRSYLRYPELNLPRTSNSAEVMVRHIRKLCNRAHGFRTIKSLTLWVGGLIKHRQTITCNGNLPTKLTR